MRAIENARATGIIGPDVSGAAADEGTAAHAIREECLSLGMDAYDYEGTTVLVNGRAWPVTREMVEALQPGIDWIRERAAGDLLVEQRVALDPWLLGQFGTVDCAFTRYVTEIGEDDLVESLELTLSDLKFGFNAVAAEENIQQKIYGLGVCRRLFGENTEDWPDRIRIVIDQPRKGGIKEWFLPKADLLVFADWIAERGREALSDAGVFRPSTKACEWCPLAAPGLCAARTEWIASDLLDLEDLDDLPEPPAPWTITPERRSNLLKHSSVINKWLAGLHQVSFDAAYRGNPDPGWKLVLGDEGNRKWADEEKARELLEEALGADAYERKLKSVAQTEKVLKPGRKKPGDPIAWADLSELIVRDPARPVLAPSNDKRDAYVPLEEMAAELDDLDDL